MLGHLGDEDDRLHVTQTAFHARMLLLLVDLRRGPTIVHLSALTAALCLAAAVPAASGPATPEFVVLPGGPPVGMDYLAYDAATGRLWVPAGNTGRIDVLDTRSGKLEVIDHVATAKRGERTVGTSAATVGDGIVYVGNRADSTVCAFDAKSLARRGCIALASSPDGLAYVATTKEVWVTAPKDLSVIVLDVQSPGIPRLAGTVKLEGKPEGYAVDAQRGIFYTNLEDKDGTVAVDARTRQAISTWKPGCGAQGPRGLALDAGRRELFVACTDRLKTIDATSGTVVSELATGGGVDNIDYLPSRRLVYAASGKEARLTVALVGDDGALKIASTRTTAEGCRTVVVDDGGTAYLPDSRGGRLVVVRPAR
jgi:DNA-binding beta-propeller fold protein YncE